MSTSIEAVFENGILRPLEPLPFAEKQHVWIRVEEVKPMSDIEEWLERTQKHHDEFLSKYPLLSDSTEIIRQDRMRDV